MNIKEIISEILKGNVNYFKFIIQEYKSLIFRIVLNNIPEISKDSAKDIVEEIFIKIYKSLPKFSAKGKFENWIKIISLRSCYDYIRTEIKNKTVSIENLDQKGQKLIDKVIYEKSEDKFYDETERLELLEILRSSMISLSNTEKFILISLYFEDLSVKEIAEYTGFSESKIKTTAFRARSKLREVLSTLLININSLKIMV